MSRRTPVMIVDERYAGGTARLLAWDIWLEAHAEGAKYLMVDSAGTYFVHELKREGRNETHLEQIRPIGAQAAAGLYHELTIRIAHAFDMSAPNDRLDKPTHGRCMSG